MKALKIVGLSKSYENREVINNLSLEVDRGEVAAVMGRSGSGKTTLLLCILGFITPDRGKVFVGGKEITSLPIEQRQLAYVPQDYGLFPHLTVEQNISFGLSIRNTAREQTREKALGLLDSVQLPRNLSSRLVTDLSGGEKQRVALARAMAVESKLFLLDEPLSAIDVETKVQVGRQLHSILKKLHLPAIFVTHDPADAKALSDSIYRLEEGKLRKIH